MSLAVIHSRALAGINAPDVSIEVHISGGLPSLSIVGLPELAVRESKDRVRAAIINSRFDFPNRRITINLAPADLPKEGSRFDLPIALGILAASGQLPAPALAAHEFIGELALDGGLRPVRGALPAAMQCAAAGRRLILPGANAEEASLAETACVLPATHLLQVSAHLCAQAPLSAFTRADLPPSVEQSSPDLTEVKGQAHAKRALEIAAAGGHNLLLIGPPGTGKTMLAGRLPGILPPMEAQEAMESAAILSISDEGFDIRRWGRRPFRAPHHTASAVALVGGGSIPRPGEISLAHHGVLFLDELPEYSRHVLEVLREPMEKGRIIISRAARQAEFPARFQLVAAMNPCPCGYHGDSLRACACTGEQIRRYRSRISGPILDRIDLHIQMPRPRRQELQSESAPQDESSAAVRQRVVRCRRRQLLRYGRPSQQFENRHLRQYCRLDRQGETLLEQAVDRLGLSARAWHRILKVARTIADLEASDAIAPYHVGEAISYRGLDC
jgi:magnesium chelatase family protein